MKLSDVVSGSDLGIYTQISLIIVIGVFAGVLWYTFARRNREIFAAASQLPLADDVPTREDV